MLADVVFSSRFFQYRPTKRKACSVVLLFSTKYFSQLQAGKLRSAILSWDEPMTFEFQVGTANESLQWKLWRLRTTVAYRTWCCILNRKFFLQNFRCSTDTKLPVLYRVYDITDNKTNCSHLKAFFGHLFELWGISCSLTSFVPIELLLHLNIACNLFLFLHVIYCMTNLWHLGLGK
jgi:hypothetical protein